MKEVLETRRIPSGIWQGVMLVALVVIAFGIDYLFNLTAGRLLSPAEFSIVVSLAAVAQIMVVGSRVILTVVTRYVARFQVLTDGAARTASFFRSMFRAAWRWGILAMLAAIVLSFPLAKFLKIEQMGPVLALAVTTLLMVVRPVVDGTLQGIQHFSALGGVHITQAIFRLAIGATLILLGFEAFGAMIALPIASVIALILGWLVLNRHLVHIDDVHHAVTKTDISRYTLYTAAGLIGFALLINMDAILVRRFFGVEDAGNYSAAITLGKVIQFFPLAIIMILFPKAAQRHAGRLDPSNVLIPAMFIVGLICGFIALIYWLFGDQIVHLALGPDYDIDGGLLGLVGLAMLVLSMANVWLNYFLSIERLLYIALIALAIIIQGSMMISFHEELWQLPAAMTANGFWLTCVGLALFLSAKLRKK